MNQYSETDWWLIIGWHQQKYYNYHHICQLSLTHKLFQPDCRQVSQNVISSGNSDVRQLQGDRTRRKQEGIGRGGAHFRVGDRPHRGDQVRHQVRQGESFCVQRHRQPLAGDHRVGRLHRVRPLGGQGAPILDISCKYFLYMLADWCYQALGLVTYFVRQKFRTFSIW